MEAELKAMLASLPLEQYLRVLDYYDRCLKKFIEEVQDDEELVEKLVSKIQTVEMKKEINLSNRIMVLLVGPDWKEYMDKRIISLDEVPFDIRSTARKDDF